MTSKTKVMCVVGARPNLMKIAPIIKAMQKSKNLEPILIHTGQHYDAEMSDIFFKDLDIPPPAENLGIGSGSHAVQTAQIMISLEEALNKYKPRGMIVVGDVNSTLAGALVAAKLGIPIAHVESGLRSFDRKMPEEHNRVLTDHLADLLFVTEEEGKKNLKKEGVDMGKIFFVGNVMIDTLIQMLPKIEATEHYKKLSLKKGEYAVVTLHRPSNIDHPKKLKELLDCLSYIRHKMPVIWPIHPRAKQMIETHGFQERIQKMENLRITPPLAYLPFMNLVKHARFVLTDSGGIQEETTYLGVPCITARENTERPITCTTGTNILAGTEKAKIIKAIDTQLSTPVQKKANPLYWDGKAAKRIVAILERYWK